MTVLKNSPSLLERIAPPLTIAADEVRKGLGVIEASKRAIR